jgi:SpoVK/Ycf46/Vps4 family AAA+-type ATPase
MPEESTTPDPKAIETLRAAVLLRPDDVGLRAHFASLLLAVDPAEALAEASHVLTAVPDHRAALGIAAQASARLGDSERASSYDRLLRALGEPSAVPAPDAPQAVKLHAVRGEKTTRDTTEPAEVPRLTLDDVAGMENVKRRLRTAFLGPLENPALRRMYGKSLRGGLLLWGAPGCGKTFIARATAGELGGRFISVSLHEVLDMWIGESEKKLHELFQRARRNAPCVLFFDEVDALGRRRTQLRDSGGREVVVQFLAELDSFGTDNEGVFVLAATNHPWDVDPALRRPGRLDRTLLVLPPDQVAREAILRLHLVERPVGVVDLAALAARTDFFSGADLAHLCEAAAELALEDSIESGIPRSISMEDFERALPEIRPSTVSWLHTARNYAEFANEGGVYDELLEYLASQSL